jgi:PhzF family phenazine biosynthesis protein
MLATAADVGFSETAFVRPNKDGSLDVRYFSPRIEIPFCGHATIATAVAYARRHGAGELRMRTQAGPVSVRTREENDGSMTATLVSVPPRTVPLSASDLADILKALNWSPEELDPTLPPRVAYAGAWHPVIAAADRDRLGNLDYDMDALGDLMSRRDWATVDLVWRESEAVYHARNPFPPGGVVEDPATGAAAAAFGGYLRELGLVPASGTFIVRQGDDMGRPSVIRVTVPEDPERGISVSGTAVELSL